MLRKRRTQIAQLMNNEFDEQRSGKKEEEEEKTCSQVRNCEIEVEEIYAYMPWLRNNTCTRYDRYT